MTGTRTTKLLVLHTGLFDDRGSLEAALGVLAGRKDITRIDLDPAAMTEADWDGVARSILSAERVVTL